MSPRIVSPDTVSAMIPLVQSIADDLRISYEKTASILEACSEDGVDLGVAGSLDELQGYVGEIENLGGTVRTYSPLRVDFIAEVDGEIGYVCWQSGEQEAVLFHSAMERCTGPVLSSTGASDWS